MICNISECISMKLHWMPHSLNESAFKFGPGVSQCPPHFYCLGFSKTFSLIFKRCIFLFFIHLSETQRDKQQDELAICWFTPKSSQHLGFWARPYLEAGNSTHVSVMGTGTHVLEPSLFSPSLHINIDLKSGAKPRLKPSILIWIRASQLLSQQVSCPPGQIAPPNTYFSFSLWK